MSEIQLGKLANVSFGIGGYQDSCIGISMTLEFKGSGVCDSRTTWDANLIKCSEHCKWTEEDRSNNYDEIMRYVSDLLFKAKVKDINQLNGIPVEATLDGNALIEWRILEEVL